MASPASDEKPPAGPSSGESSSTSSASIQSDAVDPIELEKAITNKSHKSVSADRTSSRWREIREKKIWNPLRWQRIPPVPEKRSVSREATAGFFSILTFSWMTPLMTTGYLRQLEDADIPDVPPRRSAVPITEKIQEAFERRNQRGEKYPLLWALNEVFFWEYWFAGACRMVADVLMVMNPYILKYLIRFSVDSWNARKAGVEGPSVGKGVGLAVGIALIQALVSLCASQFMFRSMIVGGQVRAGLISMIFDKSLKISARARAGGMLKENGEDEKEEEGKKGKKKGKTDGEGGSWSNGRVVNLMGTDTYRVDQAASWFHVIWTCPLMIIITLVVLIINISYSALAGFAILVVGIPLLSFAVKVLAVRRRQMNLITDQRVSLTQEIINGVKFVKFFGWEDSFMNRLQGLRDREIRAIQFLLGLRAAVNAVGMSLPVFASMLAFITYSVSANKSMDPATIFSSLALFNSLRMPMNILPQVIAQTIDAWVSLMRLQEYFLAEEVTETITHDPEAEAAITITNGNFTWETTQKEEPSPDAAAAKPKKQPIADPEKALAPPPDAPAEPFKLESINLTIGRNELLAVVGSVGSGKTSLLAAMAGDMRRTNGNITMSSQIAYCPQYAWIQNATFRENIIFGKSYDREWYQTVVEASALQRDIDMLPDGDRTEIGERGITVSGGQKQRLNIARAIYFNADIIIMDDPLSAVDAHVGRHLFDKAICGLLKDKCRVLATHQLHVLEKVDRVVWMEAGRIQAVGTFPELMANNEAFAHMMKEISTDKKEEEEVKDVEEKDEVLEEVNELKKVKTAQSAKVLMSVEERGSNSVGWEVYKAYIEAAGSIWIAPILILFLVMAQGANIMTTMWLSYWTSGKYGLSQGVYIGGFAALGVGQAFLLFVFAYGLTLAGTKSSKVLMANAMRSTLRAPMSFFDTTPIGRIVNRFSKDVDVMDNNLTDAIRMYFLTLANISSVIVLVIVYFHWMAIAIVPLGFLFIFAASYYRASAREVKRHEAVLRSHVFARFGESLAGVASIRAYGLQDRFRTSLSSSIDAMNGAYFITFANQRWLSLRLDIIGISLVFTTCILVVTSRFSVDPSIAGVVLSYILQIVMMLQWCIRQLAEVENSMNSTERLYFYGHNLPSEPPLRTDTPIPESWPSTGTVTFTDAAMRYRPGLPLVLKNLSLTIPGGSRIGIVGRTGAGKSSITSALFRLVELASGTISIDGIDIATLGLHDLRNKLAIIPQDPTLFRGTIRSNLDPFNQYPTMTLLEALKASYLDSTITLDSSVDEEGLNFSLGQRQQVALARALVRGARVVVADEATSSIDVETDKAIQKSMREGFKGRTLLCVAHRLRTIIGYDMVVVMEAGEVAEVGKPRELWGREGGVFRGMCDKGGIAEGDFDVEF